MYVPAVVSVGYYFDKKRALATGISVCGSGAGAFVLPAIAALFLQYYDWKVATWFFAGLCLLCSVCGLALKPLPKRPSPEPEVDRNCCQSVFASSARSVVLLSNRSQSVQVLSQKWTGTAASLSLPPLLGLWSCSQTAPKASKS